MKTNLRVRKSFVAAACLYLSMATAAAQTDEEVDTSDWTCRYCLFDTDVFTYFTAGLGYVSDDSFKFGQYTGLGSEGALGLVDARNEYRGADGRFWALNFQVQGTERITAGAEVGKQGRYGLYLSYDQLPNLLQNSARTPFLGYNTLQLPSNWVRSATTAGMSALADSLQPLQVKNERRRLTVGGSFLPGNNWTTKLRYRRDEKNGVKSIGAAIGGSLIARFPFLTQSALIPQPTDFVTHLVDATASYKSVNALVGFGYQGSYFAQDTRSLQWTNPFTDLTGTGADSGRLALAPDNEFHQFYGTLGYRLGRTTRVTARVAVGRMEQDEQLLPFTTNPGLQSALPRSSADVEVNTRNYQLKLSTRPARKLSLNASYTYNDRQNDTPQSGFDYVITDAALSAVTRFNRNYSFTNESIDVNGSFRASRAARFSFGYKRKDVDRTLQQIRNSVDDSYWATVSLSPHENVNVNIRYTRSERDGDEFQLEPGTVPAQNPLMRKYNLADRDRTAVAGTISYTANAKLAIGLTVDYSDDEYTESQLGLTGSENLSYTADVSVTPGESTQVHVFATHQEIESTQAGSQSFSAPTGSADTEDSFDTVGLTLSYEPDWQRFSVNLDYTFSESSGETEIFNNNATAMPFPKLETRLHRAELYVNFIVSNALSWRFGWLYEDYDTSDWWKDGVDEDTISNVLSLGEDSFSYRIHMPVVSMRYQF